VWRIVDFRHKSAIRHTQAIYRLQDPLLCSLLSTGMTAGKILTPQQHRDALLSRRIKFVVEKGAVARLFRAGTNAALQKEVSRVLDPSIITKFRDRRSYDDWLIRTLELSCWKHYSRNGIENDRWAYFAKLINIVLYEIVANRELCSESDWERIRPFLHLPLDVNVLMELERLDPKFPKILSLKGMTKHQYLRFQAEARRLAEANGVPPIWFEAAWSAS
jgi:hypothetical protein